jgi:hypothetical protein
VPKRRGRNMRTTLPRMNIAPGGLRCRGVAGLFTDDRADRRRRRTPKCFLKQYLMAELKQRAFRAASLSITQRFAFQHWIVITQESDIYKQLETDHATPPSRSYCRWSHCEGFQRCFRDRNASCVRSWRPPARHEGSRGRLWAKRTESTYRSPPVRRRNGLITRNLTRI